MPFQLAPMVAFLLSLSAQAEASASLDAAAAARHLNSIFLDTKSGVVLRQTTKLEVFCGDCYEGRPDAALSAEIFNHEVGMFKSKFIGEFMFAQYVGVAFNTDLVLKQLVRCFYAADGTSWHRYNGGCACQAAEADMTCSSPHSPFANVGPDGTVVTGDSPLATSCLCTSTTTPVSKDNCFWRGPAYNTSRGLFGKSELPEMFEQYKRRAPSPVQWNELVMDACILQEILATDPASAIVAVYYDDPSFHGGNSTGQHEIAQGIQSDLRAKYGVQFPIVGINQELVLTPRTGPFFVPKAAALDSTLGDPDAADLIV
eukprot:TRINITY_DN18983_c0_g1_i1.p1 TRINITY_DN18983_c0_g1~~TRINITY_DN18983_c0_g1_i1.p1  ORF type:complete len:315 (-),score=46.75 TRINITY_DN18983_c0_g1_i1:231-1175(-)